MVTTNGHQRQTPPELTSEGIMQFQDIPDGEITTPKDADEDKFGTPYSDIVQRQSETSFGTVFDFLGDAYFTFDRNGDRQRKAAYSLLEIGLTQFNAPINNRLGIQRQLQLEQEKLRAQLSDDEAALAMDVATAKARVVAIRNQLELESLADPTLSDPLLDEKKRRYDLRVQEMREAEERGLDLGLLGVAYYETVWAEMEVVESVARDRRAGKRITDYTDVKDEMAAGVPLLAITHKLPNPIQRSMAIVKLSASSGQNRTVQQRMMARQSDLGGLYHQGYDEMNPPKRGGLFGGGKKRRRIPPHDEDWE